jgi:hypothetical protein
MKPLPSFEKQHGKFRAVDPFTFGWKLCILYVYLCIDGLITHLAHIHLLYLSKLQARTGTSTLRRADYGRFDSARRSFGRNGHW